VAAVINDAQMNPQSDRNQPTPDFDGPLIERLYHALFGKPLTPDPWTPEDAAAANAPFAHKLCLRCLQPQPRAPQSWFCPNCGEPDCDNVCKPYLFIFSMGALFRRGVMGKPTKGFRGFCEMLFLALSSFAQYNVFALIYWVWIILKELGIPLRDGVAPPPDLSDAESREPPQPPPPPSPRQRAAALALTRVFIICAIAIAGLLAAFVIVAASAPAP